MARYVRPVFWTTILFSLLCFYCQARAMKPVPDVSIPSAHSAMGTDNRGNVYVLVPDPEIVRKTFAPRPPPYAYELRVYELGTSGYTVLGRLQTDSAFGQNEDGIFYSVDYVFLVIRRVYWEPTDIWCVAKRDGVLHKIGDYNDEFQDTWFVDGDQRLIRFRNRSSIENVWQIVRYDPVAMTTTVLDMVPLRDSTQERLWPRLYPRKIVLLDNRQWLAIDLRYGSSPEEDISKRRSGAPLSFVLSYVIDPETMEMRNFAITALPEVASATYVMPMGTPLVLPLQTEDTLTDVCVPGNRLMPRDTFPISLAYQRQVYLLRFSNDGRLLHRTLNGPALPVITPESSDISVPTGGYIELVGDTYFEVLIDRNFKYTILTFGTH